MPLFGIIAVFLLSVNALRYAYGVSTQMTFFGLLDVLSKLDVDFNHVLYNIALFQNTSFTFADVTITSLNDFFFYFGQFFKSIFLACAVPASILIDLIDFLNSIMKVFIEFVGLNPFVKG